MRWERFRVLKFSYLQIVEPLYEQKGEKALFHIVNVQCSGDHFDEQESALREAMYSAEFRWEMVNH